MNIHLFSDLLRGLQVLHQLPQRSYLSEKKNITRRKRKTKTKNGRKRMIKNQRRTKGIIKTRKNTKIEIRKKIIKNTKARKLNLAKKSLVLKVKILIL